MPLHKSDVLNSKNYRPVAILPILSKLVERAVFVQMIEYFESNNLLHPNHHGFRANHSTTTALPADVRHLLLEKLLLYGFDVASSTWVRSYLFDRKQTVCIDGTCSSMLSLEFGVPQGSII